MITIGLCRYPIGSIYSRSLKKTGSAREGPLPKECITKRKHRVKTTILWGLTIIKRVICLLLVLSKILFVIMINYINVGRKYC